MARDNGGSGDWRDRLQRSKKGIKPNDLNAYTAIVESPEIKGCIVYDTRMDNLRALKPGPWGQAGRWSSKCTSALAIHFQSQGIPVGKTQIETALDRISMEATIDPLEDYLLGLQWDGVERLGSWLTTYCGAEPNQFNSMVGSLFLTGAMARALKPGCQMDYSLCLEGSQGRGKSSLVRVLGGEFTSETLPNFHTKDAEQIASSNWFIELSDLAPMARSELEQAKAFMTRTKDTYIPKYERHQVVRARWCVFIMTVNPDGSGYLKDPTGNRRIWPVTVGTMNLAALQQDRDQLFAEAVACYRRGDPWWPENDEQAEMLDQEQAIRVVNDDWSDPIQAHWDNLPSGTAGGVSILEIATNVLGLALKDINLTTNKRIATVLKNLGAVKRKTRIGTGTFWRWHKE